MHSWGYAAEAAMLTPSRNFDLILKKFKLFLAMISLPLCLLCPGPLTIRTPSVTTSVPCMRTRSMRLPRIAVFAWSNLSIFSTALQTQPRGPRQPRVYASDCDPGWIDSTLGSPSSSSFGVRTRSCGHVLREDVWAAQLASWRPLHDL